MQVLEGVLERITYYNDRTLFMVARLRADDDTLHTVVGNLPQLGAGEKLRLKGEWQVHPDYGKQFRVKTYEIHVPQNIKGIERFLASGLIKGVGPATAERIVEAFGSRALDIIEHEPHRLTEIEGIGEKKAEMISKGLKERREIMNVMSFLQGYGVGVGYAVRIYRRYGDETVAKVTENPYRLAEDVFGVGFKTADKIALEMGIAPDSPHRMRAALLHLLREAHDEGHVYLPEEELVSRTEEALQGPDCRVEREDIRRQLARLVEERHLVLDADRPERPVYPAALFYAETFVAQKLLDMVHNARARLLHLPGIPGVYGFSLAEMQEKAVQMAGEYGVLVITGGPGTGKTTTIKALIKLFQLQGLEVMLAAPTGRAAKRMTEATGLEAKTIHRLLEYTYIEGEGFRFLRDESRPLKAHVLIVDEMSMVDLPLFYHLLLAVPDDCRLVLVGDMDQLPSVGPGNVLRDIISSGAVPVVRLNRIFRQAETSSIIANAHRVNAGELPRFDNSDDFFFLQESEPERIVELILDLCSRRLPAHRNLDPINDIQVLSPMRRHILGVENLNARLQEVLNPASPGKPQIKSGGTVFRLGDKVMQVRNNYQKEVYNGDIGRIVHINTDDNEVYVRYPDVRGSRDVTYDAVELDELVLSYAVSVHKSQGSEFPVVVMPAVTQHFIMLQRNLFYTAITRAKEMVVLIGTKKALAIAVKNNKVQARYSGLYDRLVQAGRDWLT